MHHTQNDMTKRRDFVQEAIDRGEAPKLLRLLGDMMRRIVQHLLETGWIASKRDVLRWLAWHVVGMTLKEMKSCFSDRHPTTNWRRAEAFGDSLKEANKRDSAEAL